MCTERSLPRLNAAVKHRPSGNENQNQARRILTVQLIKGQRLCSLMNCCALCRLPNSALNFPQNTTNTPSDALTQSHTLTHAEQGGYGCIQGCMAFHLNPRRAEARVQLVGFQRVNEK